ncbi:MAG: terminase family protein [Candidatus Dojkabacteria bacterium]|nr:terminase family protein [Candidatus Dojkabacteria bacterium]
MNNENERVKKAIIKEAVIREKIGFEPHEGQIPVIEAYKKGKRDICLCAGRRFGKSNICGYIALLEILRPGRHVWIVSPTTDLSQRVYSYVLKYVTSVFSGDSIKFTSKPFNKLELPNGSYIECRTAENPVSLLGEELDLLIVDEAAMIKPNVYERYLYPTTSTRQGKSLFISTPNGKNWFYHKFLNTKKSEQGESFNFDSKKNPYFKQEEWERAKAILPEAVFSQEYMGNFLDDAAAVFRGIKKCIYDDCYEEPKIDHRYIMGVDLARHQDFTVITVIDRQTLRVVYWDRFNKVDFNLQKERISMIARKYNNARITIDSTGIGAPISEDLKRIGLHIDEFYFTNTSKKQLIEKLSIFIEQQAITIPNEEVLIDELESFGYTITDAGNIKYEAPTGMHDDTVCSLALAVWKLPDINKRNKAKPFVNGEEKLPDNFFEEDNIRGKKRFQYK